MTWIIDNSHSVAEFAIKHMMVSTTKGRFQDVSGTLEWDETNPAQSKVEAVIQVASITTNDEKRDGHLVSPEFFDVAQFPTINFNSTKVEKIDNNEYRVFGDLSIHGVTKPVILTVEYNGQGKSPFGHTVAGFTATTKINRRDFGLEWNIPLDAGGVLVGEDVKITLDIEALLQVPAVATA